jgi:antibiotic biosynthesis monooxygenase (ABM) superfamily enzyme
MPATADDAHAHADAREPELRTASLSAVSNRSLPHNETVTAVIRHHIRPDAVAGYEAWLKRIVPVAERFPGHRGVHIIRPPAGGSLYTVTIRFDSVLHADDWFQSSARRELLDEAAPLLDNEEQVQTVTGLEFWFDAAAGAKQVRRYKQFLLTLAVIFPLTIIVPAVVERVARAVPVLNDFYLAHFVTSAIVVALMAYVVMPRVTRWLGPWLYR